MVRVAINGFGRIGRLVLQAGLKDPKVQFVAINDLTDTKTLAHLLKYDSVHGQSKCKIDAEDGFLKIDGKKIPVFAEKDPAKLPWRKIKVDVVAECTGFFTKRNDAAKHIKAGAKKVIISAPSKDADLVIVKGVNEHLYNKKRHDVVSNASCTTNGMAPVVKVLDDNFKVKRGFILTTHSYTSTQNLVDGPHKDLRRARAAAVNIIPTSTGSARSIGQVIPELDGKLDGFALRVPTPNGSIVNVVVEVEKKVDSASVNKLFKQVSKNHLKGILEYTEEPIVSSDIIHNPHSSIFDAQLTNVKDGTLISITAWYDNEWGFSCRMIDVMKLLHSK